MWQGSWTQQKAHNKVSILDFDTKVGCSESQDSFPVLTNSTPPLPPSPPPPHYQSTTNKHYPISNFPINVINPLNNFFHAWTVGLPSFMDNKACNGNTTRRSQITRSNSERWLSYNYQVSYKILCIVFIYAEIFPSGSKMYEKYIKTVR